MKKRILALKGDGIGPEVVTEGIKILQKVSEVFGHEFEIEDGDFGYSSYKKNGDVLPQKTLDQAFASDAILLGAVGHPESDQDKDPMKNAVKGLLKIRKSLNLYCNIRPIKLFDAILGASSIKPEVLKGTDIVFYRELTGGIYFGQPRERRDNGNVAVDTCVYSKEEIRGIAKFAFEHAMKRGKRLLSVDKANVLETSKLWRETVNEMAKDYPDIKVNHEYVDAAAMKLVKQPTAYDVVLTENMFGDILTDEASQIAGSMGMLASASIGDKVGLYEPIHGAANFPPNDLTGKNVANPLATILSVAMMLDIAFGLQKEAKTVEEAVKKVLDEGYRTQDIKDSKTKKKMIVGTMEMGDLVAERVGNME